MQVNGEATRRLLQIDLEPRQRPEAGRGERERERGKWREGRELEERRNVSPAAAAVSLQHPSLPLISLYPSVPRGDRGMNDGGGKSSVGKLAEQR